MDAGVDSDPATRPGPVLARLTGRAELWILLRQALGWRRLALTLAVFGAVPALRLVRPLVTGTLVASIALLAGGAGDAGLSVVVWPMAVLCLVMILEDVTTAVAVVAARRVQLGVVRHVRGVLSRAVLRPATIGHLDDTRLRDAVVLADQGVHGATLGLMAVSIITSTVQIAQVMAFTVVVAGFCVPVAVTLLAVVLLVRAETQRNTRAGADLASARVPLLRRAEYLRDAADSSRTAKEVRTFGLAPWLRNRFVAGYVAYAGPVWRHRNRIARRMAVLYTVFAASFAGGYGLLAYAALRGRISPGELAMYVLATGGIRAGLNNVTAVHQHADGPIRALRLVERATEECPPTAKARLHPAAPRHAIRFDNVSFRYPGTDRDVLTGFDLTIAAGTSLAVVGLNGAGKSTLVKLLAGLHRPTSGRITVDGVDLTGIDPRAWRARLAVLFQDFVRYELPLRDNIGLGSPAAAGERCGLEAAARDAGLAGSLAELPRGWATILSAGYAGGVELSGGQWQRVALARVLLAARAGAGVVLLDEPTASLDVRAEIDLFQRVLRLSPGLTVILVSHRFSTVRQADRIVVVEAGQVVESGCHDDLMAAGRRYARLYRTQAERFRDPAVVPQPASARASTGEHPRV